VLVAGFALARVGVDVMDIDVERHPLVAGPRCDRLGRDPGLLVQLPQRRPRQGLIKGAQRVRQGKRAGSQIPERWQAGTCVSVEGCGGPAHGFRRS
jgi:hypothetical protein